MGGVVSSIFGKPEAPPAPPGPDPELVKKQEEQEERLQARELDSQKQIAARKRARRRGGSRMLLAERENPALGIPDKTTLGPESYSRRDMDRVV